MENLSENFLRTSNTGIFPYRPIPLPAVNVVGFNGPSYFPPFLCRPTDLHCPLDLSLRGPEPITPPTTPSPPSRKRQKIENFHDSKIISKSIQFNLDDPTIVVDNDSSDCESEVDINIINDDQTNDYVDITGNDENDDLESQNENIVLTDLTNQPHFTNGDAEENIDIVDDADDDDDVALKSGELFYEDHELHTKAIEGFAKLFDRSLNKLKVNTSESEHSDNCELVEKPLVMFPPGPMKSRKSEKKKLKARKNVIDDDSSPVSGTFIRKLRDDEELIVRKGDIDPAFNIVEITEEAKEAIARIDNRIGSYICQLCKTFYEDAFRLAMHRCPRIVHIEYKCSECEKIFNCPANLASHRRWHKPRNLTTNSTKRSHSKGVPGESENCRKETSEDDEKLPDGQPRDDEGKFPCIECGKTFRKNAYLRKHLSSNHTKIVSTSDEKKLGGSACELPFYENQPPVVAPQPQFDRYGGTPMINEINKKRFHVLSEFYLQQRDRLSAYHYNREHSLPFERYYKRTFEDISTPYHNLHGIPAK